MTEADYKLYNMPTMLARSVKKQDPSDANRWVRDDDWYREIQQMYFALFRFLQTHGLVSRDLVKSYDDTPTVVVMASDLTELGRRFVKSGIDDRWLKSFDRLKAKRDFSNVDYLSKALSKLLASPVK